MLPGDVLLARVNRRESKLYRMAMVVFCPQNGVKNTQHSKERGGKRNLRGELPEARSDAIQCQASKTE